MRGLDYSDKNTWTLLLAASVFSGLGMVAGFVLCALT